MFTLTNASSYDVIVDGITVVKSGTASVSQITPGILDAVAGGLVTLSGTAPSPFGITAQSLTDNSGGTAATTLAEITTENVGTVTPDAIASLAANQNKIVADLNKLAGLLYK